MSIRSQIDRINSNIAAAYTACSEKGATMPLTENSDNLADTVASIPEAVQPTLQSKTVTPTTSQQSVTPDSGYDGLSAVTVLAALFGIDTNSLSHFEFGIDNEGLYYTDEVGGGTPVCMGVDANGLYVTDGGASNA